jgi:YVTN family beta-propeller protein
MKFSNLAAVSVAAAVCSLICGCGDQFRPVATPLPLPSPNPQSSRFAVFTSCVYDPNIQDCSSTGSSGASTDINVSGDSVVAITPVGRSPINALVEAALVVTADRDTDSITTYNRLTLSGITTVSTPSTIGLPTGARPTSLVNANGTIYVTESGRNVVAVLGGSASAISAEVPVGVSPVNLTVLPNGKKIYVVNKGDNSVTVIDTSDNSVVTTISNASVPSPNFSSPVWTVPSADSSRVYVVNQGSSTVTVINATNDSFITNLPVGNSPNYAVFDTQNQRVVITNPGAGSISVINADPTSPLVNTVKTIAVGTNPRSVTALADGTRLYVANTGSNSVSVVNSLSLTVTKTIPVGTSPVSIASDAESAKVFTANRDSQDVSTINTSTDTEVTDLNGAVVRISAPLDPTCTPSATNTCKLNPIFVAVGPG